MVDFYYIYGGYYIFNMGDTAVYHPTGLVINGLLLLAACTSVSIVQSNCISTLLLGVFSLSSQANDAVFHFRQDNGRVRQAVNSGCFCLSHFFF